MSIAVSAVVHPSRMLRCFVCGMYLGMAALVSLLIWERAAGSHMAVRLLFPLPGLFIAFAGIRRAIHNEKSLHIDISGNGQIKVDEDDASEPISKQRPVNGHRGTVARLLPNSTVWPFMLLLRLQTEDRGTKNWVVVVLPDCMSTESFRALAVAVRWIAAHNDGVERKIL